MIGNLSLTLANRALTVAEARWREHKYDCARCSTAQRRRRTEDMCERGTRVYADLKGCQSDLETERELAKEPNPNQAELFSVAEIRGET